MKACWREPAFDPVAPVGMVFARVSSPSISFLFLDSQLFEWVMEVLPTVLDNFNSLSKDVC
jgi:hypothetical protein